MAGFLKGSYYTAIVRAFQQNSGLAAIYQAINASPWCKGCQNGSYPVDLSKVVGGGSQSINPAVGTGSGGSASGSGGSSSQGSGLSACVVQFPGLLFFSGPCILTKGGVKWLGGALCIAVGAVGMTVGVVLLASAAGQSTGATEAVKKGARTIGIGGSLLAGQPEAAAGIAAATKGTGSAASSRTGAATRGAPAPAAPATRPTTASEESARRESQRTARDIAATFRPNNRGLSRESTYKRNPDWVRQKAEANQKAKAANF
jgi:hypothetical protein